MNKNILIYNFDEPLPEQGGIERVTDILAKELMADGKTVYIIYAHPNRLNKAYQSPVIRFQIPKNNSQTFIRQLIDNLKIGVVIDQTEGGFVGPYGYFNNRSELPSKVKLIAVQHSSTRAVLRNAQFIFGKSAQNHHNSFYSFIFDHTVLPIKLFHYHNHARIVHRNLNKNYDKTVVLSPAFIKDFLHYCPKANINKLIAIPNPNTYDHPSSSILDNHLLFVGRLNNNPKGVDKLLHIWSRLEQTFPDWQLDIIGDGKDSEELKTLAKSLKLNNVVFHGFQNPTKYYHIGSILCMTSLYEGFPMVLNEAMAHGIVPVVFDTFSASKDIIENGECGFLVPPYDLEDYAAKLSMLMNNREMLLKMSSNAITHSTLFSREKVKNMWIELLDSFSL